jgi:hypothetical protein
MSRLRAYYDERSKSSQGAMKRRESRTVDNSALIFRKNWYNTIVNHNSTHQESTGDGKERACLAGCAITIDHESSGA